MSGPRRTELAAQWPPGGPNRGTRSVTGQPPPRLTAEETIERSLQMARGRFNAWHLKESKDLGWTKSLPNPPTQLELVTRPDGTRGPAVPEGWTADSPAAMKQCHPGAAGIRISNPDGTGQQAMYDAGGRLITGGHSAGTPDRISPTRNPAGHFKADVVPYMVARALDARHGGTDFRDKYFEARPPTWTPGAPRNVI